MTSPAYRHRHTSTPRETAITLGLTKTSIRANQNDLLYPRAHQDPLISAHVVVAGLAQDPTP